MGNYILLSEKRTGSTFVQTALDSHPDITSHDELFIMRTRTEKRNDVSFFVDIVSEYEGSDMNYTVPGLAEEYLKEIYNSNENVIFNLIYSQIESWYKGMNLMSILQWFDYKTIHLKRNFFDTILSMKVKGIYRSNVLRNEMEKIHLNPSEMRRDIVEYKRKYKEWTKIFKPELSIDFEDVLPEEEVIPKNISNYGMFNTISKTKTYMDPDMNKKLCDFFKVDNIPMYSYLSKYIPDKWEYVSNVDEIKEYFSI